MTPAAVPEPTLEGKITGLRDELVRLVPAVMTGLPRPTIYEEVADAVVALIDPLVVEVCEGAVEEALEAAADNMPISRPGQSYEHAAGWLRRRAEAFRAARIVRAGGRP